MKITRATHVTPSRQTRRTWPPCASAERGGVWRHETAHLDVNVIAFASGEGVGEQSATPLIA